MSRKKQKNKPADKFKLRTYCDITISEDGNIHIEPYNSIVEKLIEGSKSVRRCPYCG